MRTNAAAGRREAGAAAVWGVLLLLGLAVGLAGCGGGGDSGSLEPEPTPGRSAPPPGVSPEEEKAALNLLDLYQTAVVQEDIDQLQAILTADGGLDEGQSVLTRMSETFRRAAVLDFQLLDRAVHGSLTAQAVTGQEVLSLVDPATFAQRTRAGRTRWALDRQTDPTGTVTLRLAEVRREGPQVEVTLRGQVVAGLPTRVEVAEASGGFVIAGVQVTVPETGAVHALVPEGPRWQGIVTPPAAMTPQPLQVRIQWAGGEEGIVPHRYRLRMPGDAVVQPVAGTGPFPLFAVGLAVDGTVWAGSGPFLVRVAPGASTAQVVFRLSDGTQVRDLAVDQLGRLHAIVLVRTSSGVTANGVIVVDQDRFCQTVNVFDPAYPFRALNPETGVLGPSASTRAVAAGGGDLWLFGSDGGVARVTDAFRGGQCPSGGVRYAPVFRRETGELLANTVPALLVGRDGALWVGSALGLTRVQGPQVTHLPFDPGLSLRGDPATLEAFFRLVADALFEARPLTTVALGTVSFLAAFGQPVVKQDLLFSLAEDGAGRLWAGTLGGGLRRLEGGQDTLHVTRRDGLGSNVILALALGPEGALWAATEEGVSRIREGHGELSITTFSALDGLPRLTNGRAAPVQDVAVGPDGTVWLATDHGLFRLVHQGGVVRGSIVDRTGQPVVGADIAVAGMPFRAVTDAAGSFVLANLPPGPARLEVDGRRAAGGPFAVVVRQVTVVAGEQPLGRVVLPPPGALQLVQVAGDGQTAVVGQALSQPLVVAVRDAQGQPVAGLSVTFQVVQGQGTVSPAQAPTGPDGQAATTVALGTGAGAVVVQAEVEGLAPVRFSAVGVADRETARLILVSGDRQVGVPGQVLPIPLVVRLEDQFRNPVVGEPVTGAVVQGEGVLLASPSGGPPSLQPQQAGAGPPVTVLTDAQGQAVFRLQAGASGRTIVIEVVAPQLPQAGSVPFLTMVGLVEPRAIAVEASGRLVVVDSALRAVVRIDPVGGSAAIISDTDTGNGQPFVKPLAVAVETTGRLVVVDEVLGAVLRVDTQTGARSLVSGCPEINAEGRCLEGIIGHGPPFVRPEALAIEVTGAFVVVDEVLGVVLRVNPQTGDRSPVSGCPGIDVEGRCVGGITGSGPSFVVPKGIAVEATGALVALDSGLGAVVRVDPHTGDRAIMSGCAAIDAQRNCLGTLIGRGPPFVIPSGISVEATGALVVVDVGLGAVVRVDPHTGDRMLVSGCAAIDCVGGIIGHGPPFVLPQALAVEATGAFVVVDAGLGAVVRVDPHTGDRAAAKLGAGRGSGPGLDLPRGVAVEAVGSLVVTDSGLGAVMRIDSQTGDRTIVSGCAGIDVEGRCVGGNIGGGVPFNDLAGLTVEATGFLVIVDLRLGAVVRVDPHTGDRTIVSGCPAIDAQRNCLGTIIGQGPPFLIAGAIAMGADGELWVVDVLRKAVVRVDPHTGDRTIVSGCPAIDAQRNCPGTLIGEGLPFVIPSGISVEATGALVVGDVGVDVGLGAVVRVDPHTGDRTIVSGCTDMDNEKGCIGAMVGQGLPIGFPQAVAVEAPGTLVVVDGTINAVVRVDPGTGNRETVSDARIGRGLPFFPSAIAVEVGGSLVVIDGTINAVVRVDPHTGDRAIVSIGAE